MIRSMKNRLFALLPALLLATCILGQETMYLPWEFAGGPPCQIRDVLLHHGTLYAATECGLYKRPESGGIWEQQADTPDSTVLFLAADTDAIVAVFNEKINQWSYGRQRLHIFNSTDNGVSFQRRYSYDHNFWTTSGNPHAPGPDYINRLYALGDSSFAVSIRTCPMGCLYVQIGSTDLGAHWEKRYLTSNSWARALNPYAVQADTFAVFNDDSLKFFQTADLHQLAAAALPLGNYTDVAAGLAWVDDRITVTFQDGRYAYSDDAGQHWQGDTLPFSGVNNFYHYDNFYYWCSDAGFYRSAVVGPVVPDTLYTSAGLLGAVSGARRGTGGWYLIARNVLLWLPDGANEATPVSTQGMGTAKGQVSSLSGRLMFRNEESLWWELPEGGDWRVYDNNTADHEGFDNFITVDSVSLAVTKPKYTGTYQSIFRSVDGGLTWSLSTTYPDFFYSGEPRFLKNQLDSRVYLGKFFTADGGQSWSAIPQGAPIAALGDTLLVRSGTSDYLTFNHGQSWQVIDPLNPAHSYRFVLASRVLFALPQYPYLPILRSTDFGTHWDTTDVSTVFYNTPVSTSRMGHVTWLEGEQTLGIVADSSQQYLLINTPFNGSTGAFPSYPHPAFGRIVQKDNIVYAAYNGGIWRIPACYTEHPFATPPNDTSICLGNFFVFHGDTLDTPGTYIRNIPGLATPCDSIDVLKLQIHLIQKSWNKEICPGDTLIWNGQSYSQNGSYSQQFSTPAHCDSVVTLYLNYYQTATFGYRSLCTGDTILLNGDTITTPGTYTYTYTSFAGCDSTLTVVVEDGQDTFYYAPVICQGASYSLLGHTYTETGQYTFLRTLPFYTCPVLYAVSLTVVPDEVISLDTFVAAGTVVYGQMILVDTTFSVLMAGPNSCDKQLIVNAHIIVGVNDLNTNRQATVFPNPFQDQLTFRWPAGETAQLRLYDAQGKLCREARDVGPVAVWEMKEWPAGFYRAEVVLAGRQYVWKLVKQ